MMTKLRENTHIVLIILILAFLGTIIFDWGMNYLGTSGRGAGSNAIGVINGHEISYEDFYRMMQQEYVRIKEATGTEPDNRQMRRVREQLWDQLINQTLIQDAMRDYSLDVSDQEVSYLIKTIPPDIVRNVPQFQTDGAFDYQKYLQNLPLLDDQTLIGLEEYVRATHARTKFDNLVMSTLRVTQKELLDEFVRTRTKLKAQYIAFPFDDHISNVSSIPDQEINDYYESHQQDFTEPEKRRIKYVLYTTAMTAADSQEVYDRALSLKDRALTGEDFSELATTYSEGPTADRGGDLGYFGRNSMIKEFEEAAFNANKGDIVGPVQTAFGLHIIKIEDKKRIGKNDSVRARHILFRFQPSTEKVESSTYEANYFAQQAREEGFIQSAQLNNLELYDTEPFDQSGFIAGIGMAQDISDFAFHAEKGEISGPIESPNGFIVAYVDEIIPERVQPLDEIQNQITSILQREKAAILAKQAAQTAFDAIQSAPDPQQLIQERQYTVQTTGEFGYNEYISGVGTSIEFSGAAMQLEPNTMSSPIKTEKAYYLILLLEKNVPDMEMFESNKVTIRNTILGRKQQQFYTAFVEVLRQDAEIEDNRTQFF